MGSRAVCFNHLQLPFHEHKFSLSFKALRQTHQSQQVPISTLPTQPSYYNSHLLANNVQSQEIQILNQFQNILYLIRTAKQCCIFSCLHCPNYFSFSNMRYLYFLTIVRRIRVVCAVIFCGESMP